MEQPIEQAPLMKPAELQAEILAQFEIYRNHRRVEVASNQVVVTPQSPAKIVVEAFKQEPRRVARDLLSRAG